MEKDTIHRHHILSSLVSLIVVTALVVAVFFIVRTQNEETRARQRTVAVAKEKKTSLSRAIEREIFLSEVAAKSPLVKQFFLDPDNGNLEKIFLAEMEAYRSTFQDNIIFWVSDRDKAFHYNGEFSYVVDPEDPEDYWYEMTLYETEKYNLNINYNSELDAINLWINAPVFMDGDPLGMLGTGVNLTTYVEQFFHDESDLVETVFFNEKGEI